jgi:hypothetical protein
MNRQHFNTVKYLSQPHVGENEFKLVSEQCNVAFAEIQPEAVCDGAD